LKKKYDKQIIEKEALLSVEQGQITNTLGRFILSRSQEIVSYSFVTNGNKELRQSLIDEAVMRVLEKFLIYYEPGGSAANLIISIIYSTMYNKIKGLNWKDVYGQKIKGNVYVVENGERKKKLVKYIKDDFLSEKL
jgi:hypothetical protein